MLCVRESLKLAAYLLVDKAAIVQYRRGLRSLAFELVLDRAGDFGGRVVLVGSCIAAGVRTGYSLTLKHAWEVLTVVSRHGLLHANDGLSEDELLAGHDCVGACVGAVGSAGRCREARQARSRAQIAGCSGARAEPGRGRGRGRGCRRWRGVGC